MSLTRGELASVSLSRAAKAAKARTETIRRNGGVVTRIRELISEECEQAVREDRHRVAGRLRELAGEAEAEAAAAGGETAHRLICLKVSRSLTTTALWIEHRAEWGEET